MMCKWKYSSQTGLWISALHNRAIKDAIACEWIVCPYCGKKMKVVDCDDDD